MNIFPQNKKTVNSIKRALRKISKYTDDYRQAKNASKVFVEVGKYKNGKTKYKRYYQCTNCRQNFEKIQIDHVVEVGVKDSWDDYIAALFCSQDNLQALCEDCHKRKTREYNTNEIPSDEFDL